MADLLRGDYKQSNYGKVILSMTVLRRLDCMYLNFATPGVLRIILKTADELCNILNALIDQSTSKSGSVYFRIANQISREN